MASNSVWNSTGIVLAWVGASIFLLQGLLVVRNWRGLGTRYYDFVCAIDLSSWYRRGGYDRFRLWIGWCSIGFSAFWFTVGIAGLVSLAF